MIELLHISDSHGFADGVSDAVGIAAAYNLPLIHTGDMAFSNISDDISYATPEKMLFCIGNHDVWAAGTTDYSDQTRVYAKYFEPYAQQRGTVQTPPDTWWYKDWDSARVVSTDSQCTGAIMDRQISWLNTVLNVDKPIIVLTHMPPRTLVPINCSFTNMEYYNRQFAEDPIMAQYTPGINRITETIAKYKANVQVELCGHEHADLVGDNVGWLVCAVGSTVIDTYNDLYRSNGALTSRCVCNLVRIDPYKSVEIFRLGAMDRVNGYTQRMIAYNLKSKIGEVISW